MEGKVAQYMIKGMQQDLSKSKFNPEFAFENKNIRITSHGDNSLLSITNERGQKPIEFSSGLQIKGQVLGYAVLNKYIVLFTHDTTDVNNPDHIYRIEYDKPPKITPLLEIPVNYNLRGKTIHFNHQGLSLNPSQTFDVLYMNDRTLIEYIIHDNSSILLAHRRSDGYITNNTIANRTGDVTTWYFDSYIYPNDQDYIVIENNLKTHIGNYYGWDYATVVEEYGEFHLIELYNGDLNFQNDAYIETLVLCENDDIQKIYWVDGTNQPRFINIKGRVVNNIETFPTWNNTSFDFIAEVNPHTVISINRLPIGAGEFTAGVIQYAFSYYNKYGRQSNIFYQSDLYYTSFNDRGGQPNQKVSSAFEINIQNPDTSFDFIRIYSIFRTSENDVPTVKIVTDLELSDSTNNIQYVDSNVTGSIEDPTLLYYIGGELISPTTINQKDNTLFLGGYDLNRAVIDDSIKNLIKVTESTDNRLQSSHKFSIYNEIEGTYPYVNQLKYPSRTIKAFKYLEWYRLGIQFQHKTGKWSEAIWIADKQCTTSPRQESPTALNLLSLPSFTYTLNNSIIRELVNNKDYVKVRPVVVYPKMSDREVICQGILCPTVYNVGDRASNSPFVQSSWFARPNLNGDLSDIFVSQGNAGRYRNEYPLHSTLGNRNINANERFVEDHFYLDHSYKASSGKWIEFRHDCPIPDNRLENSEIQVISGPPSIFVNSSSDVTNFVNTNSEYYYIDQSILTFHSPDIEFDSNIKNSDLSQFKLRIVGTTNLTHTLSDINIETSSISESEYMSIQSEQAYSIFGAMNLLKGTTSLDREGYKGLVSAPIWFDRIATVDTNNNDYRFLMAFVTYPWHRQGSLTNDPVPSGTAVRHAELKSKQLSNLRFSSFNDYLSQDAIWYAERSDNDHNGIADAQIFDSNEQSLLRLKSGGNKNFTNLSYYGNVDKILNISRNNLRVSENIGKKYNAGRNNGYRIAITDFAREEGDGVRANIWANTSSHVRPVNVLESFRSFEYNYRWLVHGPDNLNSYPSNVFNPSGQWGTEPTRIQYKSSPHAVIVLNNGSNNKPLILPTHSSSPDVYESGYNELIDGINRVCFQPSGTKRFFETELSYPSKSTTRLKFFGSANTFKSRGGQPGVDNWDEHTWIIDTEPLGEDTLVGPPTNGDIWYSPKTQTYNSVQGRTFLRSGSTWNRLSYSSNSTFWFEDAYGIKRYYNRILTGDTSYDRLTPATDHIVQDVISLRKSYGYFWIGELYNDNIQNRFGGTSDEVLAQNEWLPCGESRLMIQSNGAPITSSLNLNFVEGDTYYQRYDHLKTYGWNPEALNSVVDIVSFMCETRINIDGRYDRNRGQKNNLLATPTTFNLLNPVYSQKNNYFTYHALDNERFSLDKFPNSITWSRRKLLGENIDSWTNITLIDNLELDGDKGELRKIARLNNDLFTFQDRGISNILFNTRTQIPNSEAGNIIISNSGTVDGKTYLSQIGTNNRGSIRVTPNGIYFVDGITNGIYVFTGQGMRCLSDELGFRDWIGNNVTNESWNAHNFGNFVTHYDETTGDVYFINSEVCLVYSEYLNQFTSFMSYEGVPYMFNIEGKFMSINEDNNHNSYLFEHEGGDYNMFYKKGFNELIPQYEPYYVNVIANPESSMDKIFTNVEFRADFFDKDGNYVKDASYDTLHVENEYQNATLDLEDLRPHPSSLKKKFRIWRAPIPRDSSNNRDRMRNPWLSVKLSKDKENTYRSELHDLMVYYYKQ